MEPRSVILDVDTGTDDAGALLLAATSPALDLVAATATWGNCSRHQAARNTLAVLEAIYGPGDSVPPVYPGEEAPSGPAPADASAVDVMGRDGLGDAGVEDPSGRPDPEPAARALIRLAKERPGQLTLVALAPLTTVAAALALDPGLPGRLHQLVVMGGAISIGGNISGAAEANIGHDPEAAARVVAAFGAPGALASGQRPRLVPLDVTLGGPLSGAELAALKASPLPGAGLVHQVWETIWPTGRLETGLDEDVWPAHDLLAAWCVVEPSVCEWTAAPLHVDTGRSAAWGATVADRRVQRVARWAAEMGREDALQDIFQARGISDNRWDIAMAVDVDRYRSGVRAWLAGETTG
jgi:purine nucleosidase